MIRFAVRCYRQIGRHRRARHLRRVVGVVVSRPAAVAVTVTCIVTPGAGWLVHDSLRPAEVVSAGFPPPTPPTGAGVLFPSPGTPAPDLYPELLSPAMSGEASTPKVPINTERAWAGASAGREAQPIPEPSSLLLLASAVAGLVAWRFK